MAKGGAIAALQYAASFHCLVKEWNDCEELKPRGQEKRENKASDGVVSRYQQVPMSEMWMTQLVHEDARTTHWAEVFVKEFGKMG